MDGWMDSEGWMGGWTGEGWMGGWTVKDGWVDGQVKD